MECSFNGKLSLETLSYYLSRAMTYSVYSETNSCMGIIDHDVIRDAESVFVKLGVRYVSRFISSWIPSAREESAYAGLAQVIAEIKTKLPEIVFEACIFETAPKSVDSIEIPEFVFKAFDIPFEKRCFDNTKMMYDDGFGKDRWGTDFHVPDITKLETQMFFYYRACKYISIGIEGLHLGQTGLMGKKDEGNACWERVVRLIRAYAAENSPRHYVIINSHGGNSFVDSSGAAMTDFIASPSRIEVATARPATNGNPQKVDIFPGRDWGCGDNYTPYLKKRVGISPSGWKTERYPYLVEFDNWGIQDCDHSDPSKFIWGYDEISWLSNQPDGERREFLKYLSRRVASFADNGFLAMPGRRIAYLDGGKKLDFYSITAFGDEETVAEIWNEAENR